MKDIQEHQWSMGNGQCPVCYGHKPNARWWTDTVGHEKACSLAVTMEKAGLSVEWEHENPSRSVGFYIPKLTKGNRIISFIRADDPDKEEKLSTMDEQVRDGVFPWVSK